MYNVSAGLERFPSLRARPVLQKGRWCFIVTAAPLYGQRPPNGKPGYGVTVDRDEGDTATDSAPPL